MARYKFSDIVFNSTAKKNPEESDKTVYIGLEHLDSQNLHVSRYGSDVAPISGKLIMKKGDVLFGKRRAYQKKVAIAPFDGIFSAHGMVLRPKEDVIDKDYFPFFISSDYFLDAAIKISVGSLSPTINWGALKELEFDLPDIDEQKKLAKILWAAEKLKQKYKNIIVFANNLISEEIKRLCNISELIQLGECVEKERALKVDVGTHPYLEIGDIDVEMNNYVIKEKESVVGAKYAERDEIVVSLVRPSRGALAKIKEEALAVSGAFVLLKGKDEYLQSFIYHILTHNNDFFQYLGEVATGTMYPTCKKEDVYRYTIPFLSIEKQQEFVNKMELQSASRKIIISNTIKIKEFQLATINGDKLNVQ